MYQVATLYRTVLVIVFITGNTEATRTPAYPQKNTPLPRVDSESIRHRSDQYPVKGSLAVRKHEFILIRVLHVGCTVPVGKFISIASGIAFNKHITSSPSSSKRA